MNARGSPHFGGIPRSRQNPKILGRDDAEVIRNLVAIGAPFSGYLLTQERQDRGFEIGERRMTSIVRDVLVHQAPQPLDRIQMRAVAGDEMQRDPTSRPR